MPRCCREIFVLLLCCASVLAQFDTGQISGYVRDASQAVVTGALVTVTNQGNGDQKTIATNSSGFYVIPTLRVGTYTVTAEMPGFKKTVQSGVVLDSAARLSIDLMLTVGQVSESVEVKG